MHCDIQYTVLRKPLSNPAIRSSKAQKGCNIFHLSLTVSPPGNRCTHDIPSPKFSRSLELLHDHAMQTPRSPLHIVRQHRYIQHTQATDGYRPSCYTAKMLRKARILSVSQTLNVCRSTRDTGATRAVKQT